MRQLAARPRSAVSSEPPRQVDVEGVEVDVADGLEERPKPRGSLTSTVEGVEVDVAHALEESSAVRDSARDSGSWSRQASYSACRGAKLGPGSRPTALACITTRMVSVPYDRRRGHRRPDAGGDARRPRPPPGRRPHLLDHAGPRARARHQPLRGPGLRGRRHVHPAPTARRLRRGLHQPEHPPGLLRGAPPPRRLARRTGRSRTPP